jgi:hypothetical protein
MTATEIAAALGRARRSGTWWRCRCPVHGSRGPTLALQDGERGLMVKCHAGCSREDVVAELRNRGLVEGGISSRARPPPAVPYLEPPIERGIERRITMACRIWNHAQNARGTPVMRYLAGRCITIPLPPSLRWMPGCRHPSGLYVPAMVARVDDFDGELIGVHRTWIERGPDGVWRRRDRASLGPISGGAVRLAPADKMLLIAEGIETCAAAMQATGLPGWAALSTSGLITLALPAMVRTVIILTDHDRNGAGERAAHTAARRWLAEGRRVQIAMPPEPGTDFADVLAGGAHTELDNVTA